MLLCRSLWVALLLVLVLWGTLTSAALPNKRTHTPTLTMIPTKTSTPTKTGTVGSCMFYKCAQYQKLKADASKIVCPAIPCRAQDCCEVTPVPTDTPTALNEMRFAPSKFATSAVFTAPELSVLRIAVQDIIPPAHLSDQTWFKSSSFGTGVARAIIGIVSTSEAARSLGISLPSDFDYSTRVLTFERQDIDGNLITQQPITFYLCNTADIKPLYVYLIDPNNGPLTSIAKLSGSVTRAANQDSRCLNWYQVTAATTSSYVGSPTPKCSVPNLGPTIDTSQCQGEITAATCSLSCATNYLGLPAPTWDCPVPGPFSVISNCLPLCKLGTSLGSNYDTRYCAGSRVESACRISCASAFKGSPTVSCPTPGGNFTISGTCSPSPLYVCGVATPYTSYTTTNSLVNYTYMEPDLVIDTQCANGLVANGGTWCAWTDPTQSDSTIPVLDTEVLLNNVQLSSKMVGIFGYLKFLGGSTLTANMSGTFLDWADEMEIPLVRMSNSSDLPCALPSSASITNCPDHYICVWKLTANDAKTVCTASVVLYTNEHMPSSNDHALFALLALLILPVFVFVGVVWYFWDKKAKEAAALEAKKQANRPYEIPNADYWGVSVAPGIAVPNPATPPVTPAVYSPPPPPPNAIQHA